ncbi:hypothetical protein JOB18_033466 [Solea senegalensis]|uniref:Uncharacterized protein n=1 Tax=Solea senegalensis TaxID=28829 RepID=A0AAV6RME4_SOLSE|nr:hypothetical protein JOB18_033466 [Solea senegalensis]
MDGGWTEDGRLLYSKRPLSLSIHTHTHTGVKHASFTLHLLWSTEKTQTILCVTQYGPPISSTLTTSLPSSFWLWLSSALPCLPYMAIVHQHVGRCLCGSWLGIDSLSHQSSSSNRRFPSPAFPLPPSSVTTTERKDEDNYKTQAAVTHPIRLMLITWVARSCDCQSDTVHQLQQMTVNNPSLKLL